MLGILAAVAFLLAFLFHGAGFAGSPWLDWESLLLAGLALLALHLLGVAPVTWRRAQ